MVRRAAPESTPLAVTVKMSSCNERSRKTDTITLMATGAIYLLKLHGRTPSELRLDRIAEYLRLLAQLLGLENQPIFSDVRDGSVLLAAYVEPARIAAINARLNLVRAQPDGKEARPLRDLEDEMRRDGISDADLIDPTDTVVCRLHAANEPVMCSVCQSGEVDGEVTGVMGVDNTLHVRVRDLAGRDVRLTVRNLDLGRDLARAFRAGPVRLHVHGQWNRTPIGWLPDAKKCFIDRFEPLDAAPPSAVFAQLRAIPGNGWQKAEEPLLAWSDLRGLKI